MGWGIQVEVVNHYAAICTDELGCPGPREKGQWMGPLRDSSVDAERDAREHRDAHEMAWKRMNEEWDKGQQ